MKNNTLTIINNNIVCRYLTILLCFFLAELDAQHFKPALSEKHVQKVLQTDNAVLKLRKYKRFLHRDSLKQARQIDRYWQAQTDSLYDAIAAKEKALSKKGKAIKDGAGSKMYNSVYKRWARKQAEQQIKVFEQSGFKASSIFKSFLQNYFKEYFLQATQNDSMLVALKAQLPSLLLPRHLSSKVRDFQLIHPEKTLSIQALVKDKFRGIKGHENVRPVQDKTAQSSHRINEYIEYVKVLQNRDSLKRFAKAHNETIVMNHLSKTEQFSRVSEVKKYQSELDKFKALPRQYKTQAEKLADSVYIKEEAKKKAEDLAMRYVTAHPELIQGVQKKMNLLMKKYSVVPNSNDLSTAIKRSSLKGRTIKERLVFASNFQVYRTNPLTIDLSPSVGYKLNRNFVVGAGGNYRQTFSADTIPNLAAEVFGYKAFVSHDLFSNFFAYGEFDRNSRGFNIEGRKLSAEWRNAAFGGVGRKVRVHAKVEMIILMMYNFIHQQNDVVYPRRFVVKVGFQNSEIALLKRR